MDETQGRRNVWKSGGGARSTVVGIINMNLQVQQNMNDQTTTPIQME